MSFKGVVCDLETRPTRQLDISVDMCQKKLQISLIWEWLTLEDSGPRGSRYEFGLRQGNLEDGLSMRDISLEFGTTRKLMQT